MQNTLFSDIEVETKRDEAPAIKSPLRYPGGKSRGVKEILQYFPEGLDTVVSPFLGGGSIELALANRGVKVYGYDVFEPLTAFWQVLLKEPEELAELVRRYYPLTGSQFYSLQRSFLQIRNKRDRAAVFFVLNRASFSGTTLSGGMSPNHPRFTEKIIEYLETFSAPNLHVGKMDFHDSIAKHENDFLYLDPPYANGGGLYGHNGDTHKDFDHTGLAAMLRKRDGWALSYNDCDKVRDWYKGYTILTPQWAYGMNAGKKSNEVLILSKDLLQYETDRIRQGV
ncbi:MAG: DNA adenine methylase [Bacteroidales bacterium]